ncbi:cholesterol oxidase substrate-binding domain-containing protein [Kutzneria albida]|uniref:Substrate-binding cholesterol oxidase n=1 Tax=Kutzneria albida DSM 43870 TaxID=1449976 RepID=W5W8X8_9PSEU|nr:cholesterol oxidase substrate-binding domain-containing protein [Kutzneria albida]AHH97180.1 substrate-binding cholesterol oxidase [Kutzneria albida DSM 43870]
MSRGNPAAGTGRHRLVSRRSVMKATAAAAVVSATAWQPVASAATTLQAPPGFPQSLEIRQRAFRNWSGQVSVDQAWTCSPRTAEEVVRLANWAHATGWTLRPRGQAHGWSPFVLAPGHSASTILLDLREHFTARRVDPAAAPTVTAQAGVLLEDLLADLERAGLGLAAHPAPGDLTIGGVLAIGGHGTGISTGPGDTARYGSVSNLVRSLRAIVWDPASQGYREREFGRGDPEMPALLVNLGRVLITEATLDVQPNRRLLCRSVLDVPVGEVFAAPEHATERSFANQLAATGAAEVIWFPYTEFPWTKYWSVRPEAPRCARRVASPYNYGFSDSLPDSVTAVVGQVTAGACALTPALMHALITVASTGLLATGTLDVWGWAKDVLLYVRPTTLRVTANGYAVLTRRAEVQRVVSDFHQALEQLLGDYRERGEYPMNGPLEVRVTELDEHAAPPLLSAIKPCPGRPEFDVAVWFDVLTVPGTRASGNFFRDLEEWAVDHYCGDYALVRPEWSKGWAYGAGGAWSDEHFLATTIPAAHGRADWDRAAALFERMDPHGVFAGPLHRTLFPTP